MIDPTSESPPGRFARVTRRSAIGGLMAAMLTPAALSRTMGAPQAAGAPPGPAVPPLPRKDHTVTPLGAGMLLVAGGFYLGPLAGAQIFDLTTGAWYAAAPMLTPRYLHAAVAMGDGSVLVAGGMYQGVLAEVERYDPTSDSWQQIAPMLLPRCRHSAAPYGAGALMCGGDYLGTLSSPEFFDGQQWQFL